jgi:glycosyltransferase involved in cell wall biosynthesis
MNLIKANNDTEFTQIKSQGKKMKVSLILVSKDEEKHLPKFLSSLKKQTRKPDEIILVDSSSDKTPKIMKPYVDKIITVEPRGCCRARIIGINKSRGDIIVFADIDSILYPNWLEELVKPFSNPDIKVVQGRINSKSYDGKMDSGIFSSDLKEKGKFICGCNVAFRRSVLEEFPLDPYMTWEDIELGYRISKKYDIYGARNAIVHHYGASSFEERNMWNSAVWSGVGWSRILLKHKNMYWFFRINYNIFNVLLVHGLKAFLLYTFAFYYALLMEINKKNIKNNKTGSSIRKVIN